MRMEFSKKVKKALEELKPKLEELADGHVELVDADPSEGEVTLKLIGGRLC